MVFFIKNRDLWMDLLFLTGPDEHVRQYAQLISDFSFICCRSVENESPGSSFFGDNVCLESFAIIVIENMYFLVR